MTKYRLETPHYIDDMYLETGTEVGDGTGIPFRYIRDSNTVRPDGKRTIVKAGDMREPSIAMTPLDDDAKEAYRKRFGEVPPERDPLERIPIMGNVQSTENIQPGKSPIAGAKGPTATPPGQQTLAGKPMPQPVNPPNKPPATANPATGPVPGAPDNRVAEARTGTVSGQPTPASPAPSGPGSGKTEEEAKK